MESQFKPLKNDFCLHDEGVEAPTNSLQTRPNRHTIRVSNTTKPQQKLPCQQTWALKSSECRRLHNAFGITNNVFSLQPPLLKHHPANNGRVSRLSWPRL